MIAGDRTSKVSGDGGPAGKAQIFWAVGISCDSKGQLYFGDLNRVLRIDTTGTIQTIAGNGLPQSSATSGDALSVPVGGVLGLVLDTDGSLFISVTNGEFSSRVSVVDSDGTISLYAGASGGNGHDDGDGGAATAAHLVKASTLAMDSQHNLFILEPDRIRKKLK